MTTEKREVSYEEYEELVLSLMAMDYAGRYGIFESDPPSLNCLDDESNEEASDSE